MADLIATPAVSAPLPVTHGDMVLDLAQLGPITSIAPFQGQEKRLSQALHGRYGGGFPAPGQSTGGAEGRLLWSGRGQAFLIGAAPDPGLSAHAALTDQSDSWAAFRVSGPAARDVLARLCPVDLDATRFEIAATARGMLGHMAALIWRQEADTYVVLVFRSMAETALHELEVAMRSVAARAELAAQT